VNLYYTAIGAGPRLCLKGGGGGGGSSGKVSWSSYLETIHKEFLTGGDVPSLSYYMTDDFEDAHDANPYTTGGIAAYDPTTPLATMTARYAVYDGRLQALSPSEDFLEALDTALSRFDSQLNPQSAIDDAVDSFSDRQLLPLNRAVAIVAGQFGAANAVCSSAFPMALAAIANDHLRSIADFRAKLGVQVAAERVQTAIGLAEKLWQVELDRIDREQASVQLGGEIERVKIVALKEQADVDATIAVKSALWPLELYQYPANLISAIQGGNTGASVPPMHGGSSAIGGAIGGAVSGAAAGAPMGPYGMAAGAIIGGIGGYLSSS